MLLEGLKAAGQNMGVYQVRIPDAIVVRDLSQPLVAGNLKAVVEIKFNQQTRDPFQIQDYERIAGDPNRVIELSPEECMCQLPEPERVPALERERARERVRELGRERDEQLRRIYEWEYWEETTKLTGWALVLYLIVSEGSRILFPPRNLVPVP
jgi:hypothetical protein